MVAKNDRVASLRRSPPISFRRLAELRGVTEGAVRKAVKSGSLPEPLWIEGTGGKPGPPFFLLSMVAAWRPKE